MSKTIVSIISQQTSPNYLFIREMYEPGDQLLFITSTKMEAKIQPIIETLNWPAVNSQSIVLPDGKEEDWSVMCRIIKEHLNKDSHYAVNLTGGTKYMALAVQKVFEEFHSDFYYIPYPRNVILTPEREFDISTRMTVEEYLSVYGHKIHSGKLTQPLDYSQKFFQLFINSFDPDDFEVIDHLRSLRNIKKSMSPQDIENSFTELTEKPQIVEHFLKKCAYPYTDKLNRYDIQYLTGGWFEEYVYYLVKRDIKPTDIKIGVKLNTTNNDLDVVFTKNNSLYVIECKTGIEGGSMLNQIAYKCAALNDYIKGLSAKSFVFALANDDIAGKIPQSLNITYFGKNNFLDPEEYCKLVNTIAKK